ncbi:MAG: LapA family protein [Emcibacter sp.]|nr:LapA family protein [Emcibacter sp.]
MRIISLAAFIIFTAFCIIVAVANRVDVTFSLAPLPFAWDLPLYILLFAGIFIGLGAGSLVVIAKSVRHARHNRQQTKIIRELEKQIKDQKKDIPPAVDANEIPQDQKQIS